MKTSLIFLASIAAVIALPVDVITKISALFVLGFSLIVTSDYRRARPSVDRLIAAELAPREPLRLAA